MVSVNNTSSNSFVLASLRQTNKDIATSQTRIGTGLKINGASDGAAAWSTAQSIRSDIKTQTGLTSSISVAKAKTDAAVAGIDQITTLINKVQDIVTAAGSASSTATVSSSTVAQLKSLTSQITTAIAASGFQSENFLTGTTDQTVKIGSASGATITLTGDNINAAGSDLVLLTTAANAITTASTNANVVANLETLASTAISTIGARQATLSGFSSALESQVDFLSKLDTIKNTALSAIVDTDMEAESAKVTALQVKQQLAYQALAITNSSTSNILTLFQ